MTPGHRIPTDTSTTRRLRRWAPALALCATALLSACSDDDKQDPPGDTTPPTVTITDDTDGVASGDVTFSFTFTEDVGTSFAASDVTVSAGAKGALVKASATLYRIVVTPPENAAGDLTVSVPVGAFTDTSGNANTAAASTTQAYDTAVALQQMDLPLSFDAADVEYGVVPFDGATADLAADPADAGNTVVQIVKPAAAALWAGAKLVTVVDTAEVGLASRIPFDADNTRMTMRVYAPAAGTVVLLKLEVSGSDPVVAVETQATTTQANAWETLTFDFADHTAGSPLDVTADYDRIAIFPAFMTAGAGESYYFDDVTFIGGGGTGTTGPQDAPAAPTADPADVISLLSTVYTDHPVDTWGTSWSNGGAGPRLTELTVAGVPVKQYSALQFVGIEFTGANMIDAATPGMTHFHVDLWTPDITNFQVKLVDFGADGAFGGGDDSEGLFTSHAGSTPPLTGQSQWVSLDIPLTSFAGTFNKAHLAQLLFVSGTGSGTAYVTNVYLHKVAGPTAPTTAPAAPDEAAADVISLLSTVYTDHPVDTWGTSWSNGGAGPALTELTIAGAPVKLYSDLQFVGIEFTGANMIDAATPGMTHFHVDLWTPDITNFQVKLVDFGADGAVGGGDDTEGLFTSHAGSTPPLTGQGQWVSLDIPFTAFAGTFNKAHLAQLLFVSGTGDGTAYVTNVYFYKGAPAAPAIAAPTPGAAAADVISLYSDAYTNVAVDTWRTGWTPGPVVLTDPYDIPGTADDAKKYQFFTGANYAGVEFTGANMIDATAMTHFHIDVWTPDATNFQVKLVDFGADGAFAGGDDTEGILTLTGGSTPPLALGQWVSYDVTLDATSFPGLANRAHLAQMVFVSGAGAGTAFVDNIYFHK